MPCELHAAGRRPPSEMRVLLTSLAKNTWPGDGRNVSVFDLKGAGRPAVARFLVLRIRCYGAEGMP